MTDLLAGIADLGELNDKAKVALDGLSAKLERAQAEAFAAGLDFAHGPVQLEDVDLFAVRDIWAPQKVTVEVAAGPVDRAFEPPSGWVVYRNPDYDGPEAL